jgi:hypothetical protein
MLTVVIEANDDPEALVRTLTSLVHGAMEGIVREVVVHDRYASQHIARVADHAGCRVLDDNEFIAGLQAAKGTWLLALEPGARLSENWIEAVLSHTERTTRAGRFSPSRASAISWLARLLRPTRAISKGLLVTKAQAISQLRAGEGIDALAARLRPVRVLAEISMPPRRAQA